MHALLRTSLCELVENLKEGHLSATELMRAVLERIEETNPDLNSFVALHTREKLLADAAAADARIAKREARPLEGIPLGVKDLEPLAGLPFSEGSQIYRDRIADHDAIHVQRLAAAGAIPIGKTNAPEFGYTAITKNLVYGVTRSPWNLEHTPGGSSGGSAAALAGCVCPLVTASDGGGSIRIPASFTGSFGLKPSYGRVPRGPWQHWEYGDTSCYGPLTKSVADAALFLDQVVGPSAWDPTALPHPGFRYAERVEEPLPPNLRIGFSADLGYAVVQSDIAAAVEEAAHSFEKLGHRLEAIDGGPPQLGREWALLGCFELAAQLHEYLPEREQEFGHSFIEGVKKGFEMTPQLWRRIGDQRVALSRWCAELFEHFDLLITPTVPYDPPPAKGPFPGETEGRPQHLAGVASFTIPFNLSWNPAATVRAGLSQRGLPIGMQIVAPLQRDELALQAARSFERERPWHPQWPSQWEPLPERPRKLGDD